MATGPRRALIVMGCVVAVAVGGVALPATSYGDVPGSKVDVAGSSDSAGFGGLGDISLDLGSNEESTETPTETPASMETPAETQTPAPVRGEPNDPGGSGGSDGSSLIPVLLVVGFVVLGLVAVGIARNTVGSKLFDADRADRFGGLPALNISNPLRAIAARTTAVTLSIPSTAGRLGHALQEAVVGTGSALGSAASALRRAGRMQASALGALASALGGAGVGLSTSLSDLTPEFGRDDLREVRPTASGSDEDASGGEEKSGLSVGEAWAEMRRFVSISNVSARTPAEVARAAVDQGLPQGPVMRLTESFREVTYGRADPKGIRETAVEALRSVRNAIGGER
ncbi:MAG: DUF4129 domain-containing protein [Halobacteriales archaeon]